MDKYRVTLTAEERYTLERLVSAGKGAARRLIHARVLLLADTSPGTQAPKISTSTPLPGTATSGGT